VTASCQSPVSQVPLVLACRAVPVAEVDDDDDDDEEEAEVPVEADVPELSVLTEVVVAPWVPSAFATAETAFAAASGATCAVSSATAFSGWWAGAPASGEPPCAISNDRPATAPVADSTAVPTDPGPGRRIRCPRCRGPPRTSPLITLAASASLRCTGCGPGITSVGFSARAAAPFARAGVGRGSAMVLDHSCPIVRCPVFQVDELWRMGHELPK
jgi:hypothetical protein